MTPPVDLLRSWLFTGGVDTRSHEAACACGADVIGQDLEDFTPPALRPQAHALAARLYAQWRAAGALAAVRVNPLDPLDPLDGGGFADLAAVMPARPDIVMLPKTVSPEQIIALDAAIAREEARCGIAPGSTAIVPNVETAAGVVATGAIVRASPRIRACLVGAEDMAADLCAERGRDGIELVYVRSRFLVECRAAGVEPIDAPYTYADAEGCERETRMARRLGYRAKSLVRPEHAAIVNAVLTPSAAECAHAQRVVDAFEAARARGEDRVNVDGALIEVPAYLNAQRLLERARRLAQRP